MAIELISILAIPRTGTNYLCGLLGKFKEIDSLYEIYHHQAVYLGQQPLAKKIVEYLNQEYKLQINCNSDLELINFVKQNPQKILDIIQLITQKKYISFKIFPGHLSEQYLNQIIIENNGIKKILVKRNLLNVYFSWKFAMMTAHWSNQDTSKLKLTFDADNFMQWFNYHQQYYDAIETKLSQNNQEITILEYEQIHSLNSHQEKFIFLFNFLTSIGLQLDPINLANFEHKFKYLRTKQDPRINILDKVHNPRLLVNTLEDNQLEFLLNNALGD